MQRYHQHPATCTSSAVNNNSANNNSNSITGAGGISGKDSPSSSSSSLSGNFSINNSRRPSPLASYKLKCEKEPLNSRLGPPDYHPQTPNCPEETLTKEYVQSGYRETVEGLEEAKEISVTQVHAFTKPVILKCKEAIRKRLRAINDSRAQKRKAGQVYGEPLSGSLLGKPTVYPELKPCGEEFKKRWIEGLSQYHKSLRLLADHVPLGYRKKSLFEVLIRNNVPLLRATWFIKVTYLNQVRPISPGSPDRSHLSRSELWTKDVTDYLQSLLDDLVMRNSSQSLHQNRDRSPQMLYAGSVQQKSDSPSLLDSDEPSLHFKWWYVVRILNWHHAEGLIIPSQVIEWVFLQFQAKDIVAVMQFMLPILYGVLEVVALCQTYVRKLVDLTLRYLKEPFSTASEHTDDSRRVYTSSALVEMLQYLVLSVPDTFVAMDCFPFPHCLTMHAYHGHSMSQTVGGCLKNVPAGALHITTEKKDNKKYHSTWFSRVVSSIQKRAMYLAKAASPGYSGQNVAKAVQALDKALVQGDVQEAYKLLFQDLSDSSDENWIAEVSPCLLSSLKCIGSVGYSMIYSVFLLCEWCTCDFRDSRTATLSNMKFSGRKDFSQLYIAVRLMRLKIREMHRLDKGKKRSERSDGNLYNRETSGSVQTSDLFESPGPLHDIIVCWIDQHDSQKGEGFKRVQFLLMELIRSGIFSPQAYARQLLVSGIMDTNGPFVDLDRRKRHYRILKQLSSSCMSDVFDEAQIPDMPYFLEAMHVYANERRLLLRGLIVGEQQKDARRAKMSSEKKEQNKKSQKDLSSLSSSYQLKMSRSSSLHGGDSKKVLDLGELKGSILELLHLPKSSPEAVIDDSQVSLKRSVGNVVEGTPGCEECRRAKRQKLGEEKYTFLQGPPPNPSDDEDTWWMRKETKSSDSVKVDQPLKPIKQAPRGRQKTVRKTQSLAQLAAARIEGSQGASTSHVCESRVVCPHHRPVVEGDTSKSLDGSVGTNGLDILSIGKMLKRLKLVEKRSVSVWLLTSVKQVVEESEKSSGKGQLNRSSSSVDDKVSSKWKLGEDELSIILYLMDICADLPAAIRFLIWLLPKALSSPSTPMHGGRNVMLSRNVDNLACDVREPFLLSTIRRYENILVAADLVPEILSAAMHRAATSVASNGTLSGSQTLTYARYLLKKYGTVIGVAEWEKSFRATCDRRLLSELETGRLQNGEHTFSYAVPAGVEDPDDIIRKKISGGRLSRIGMNMREKVQTDVDEAVRHLFGKERKLFGASAQKNAGIEKWDDGYQIAQQIVSGLMESIKQTGGAAQEGDPSLVSSAVSAIVGNVGPAIAKMPDFTAVSNHSNFPAPTGSLGFARRVLRIHINCLCLLKEKMGERHSRAFEIALATEATSALAGALLPGKGARGQFQLSPEAHDSNMNLSNDVSNNSTKVAVGRATKIAAAVSALVIGAVIHGVASLDRMVAVFKLREGLDLIQFVRSTRSQSNGTARSVGALKVESSLEVCIHWFRLLVGNCRTVSDGIIVDLLGEPSVVALSRLQRTLPLSLVLPPAYSLFAFLIWRPLIFNVTMGTREEIPQLFQSLNLAIGDAIKHSPFRDVCMRDTHGLFDIVISDSTDSEFASILEINGSDRRLKAKAFVPLRSRLFLNALIDCKLPHSMPLQDDAAGRLLGMNDPKLACADSETKISDRLVRTLDSLQPAKFHWQWVELRLFLNEQTVIEKFDSSETISIADVMRSLIPNPEKGGSLENENNFIPIVLTRLLVRPDAAPLLSELVHLFGRSLEDSMLLHVKWFLEGHDVLFGRKSIRQRLVHFAETKGFSTRPQFWKPWGWFHSYSDPVGNRGAKRRLESPSREEGEVVEEDSKRNIRAATKVSNDGLSTNQLFVTERALVELVLPCIDRSTDDSRTRFASELIKQMINIEQQISGVSSGSSKQLGSSPSGTEGSSNKSSNRKSMKGGSPGLSRRTLAPAMDSTPSSPAALRASLSLRLQLLVRLLPTICGDGDLSSRSSRYLLASVIIRLLGNRVVFEDMELTVNLGRGSPVKEAEIQMETCASVSLDLSGKKVFDWLLLVLHALLSSTQPSWLIVKSFAKNSALPREFSGFGRDIVESLQSELDRMQLPDGVRWRIQAAMPVLVPSRRTNISCQPSSVSLASLASLQSSTIFSTSSQVNPSLKNSGPPLRNCTAVAALGKSKMAALHPDNDMEVDPWMLLEDGAGSGASSSNSAAAGGGDHTNFRASSWLKGAVRVRRADLTYVGTVDDEN